MADLSDRIRSNMGLKMVMASSGLLLVGFIVIHMVGNLQVYLGPKVFNHYAETLQGTPELIWTVRLVLLTAVLAHIGSAATLVLRARAARPVGYEKAVWLSNTYAVRTMRWGGVILFLFIGYHLLHLTVGVEAVGAAGNKAFQHCHWEGEDFRCHAYANLVFGFRNPLVVGFYALAQIFLGMHLAHGIWSMARTLGFDNPRFDRQIRRLATTIGVIITLGNISIPVSVLTGIVTPNSAPFYTAAQR
jgi:succinate dehydrogenase / fumarate reductase cytochrome b subunit